MRGEGFSFYFAGLGVEPRLLKTALPSATVRNHLQLSGLQTTFGGLKRCAMPFVAHVALRGILTNLIKCRKSFCVTGTILLRGFRKMTCIFRGRCSTWDVSMRNLHVMKIDGSLAQNIDFEAANFVVHERTFCSCET